MYFVTPRSRENPIDCQEPKGGKDAHLPVQQSCRVWEQYLMRLLVAVTKMIVTWGWRTPIEQTQLDCLAK